MQGRGYIGWFRMSVDNGVLDRRKSVSFKLLISGSTGQCVFMGRKEILLSYHWWWFSFLVASLSFEWTIFFFNLYPYSIWARVTTLVTNACVWSAHYQVSPCGKRGLINHLLRPLTCLNPASFFVFPCLPHPHLTHCIFDLRAHFFGCLAQGQIINRKWLWCWYSACCDSNLVAAKLAPT